MRTCDKCGNEYKRIGTHWRHRPSHRPDFSEKQMQILRGLMAGDGSLHKKNDKNPYVVCGMTNNEYLKHLEDVFGSLGKDVVQRQTAEESAEAMRRNGLRPNAKTENYKAVYKWATRSHNQLHQFKDWYDDEENKVIPTDFELTPLVLKHWYVGDGHLQTVGNFFRCGITLSGQRENRDNINKLFKEAGLPEPIWRERNAENKRTSISWNKEASREILDYMGSPPPGFEYKWP